MTNKITDTNTAFRNIKRLTRILTGRMFEVLMKIIVPMLQVVTMKTMGKWTFNTLKETFLIV